MAVAARGAPARRSRHCVRGAGGFPRQDRLLCRARARRRYHRPGAPKFYGDVQEKITAASSHLFFGLELNRIDERASKGAEGPRRSRITAVDEDVRAEKPYQLEDRVELLFHEKLVTGRGAWNRLFDETMAACASTSTARSWRRADAASASDPRGEAQGRRKGAGRDVRGECPPVHAHHQYARQGQGNLRPLARLQRRRRRPAIWPTGSRPRWSTRWSRPCARPIRGSRTATTAEGELVRARARLLGPQRAAARSADAPIPWDEARAMVLGAYGRFSPRHGRDRAALLRRALDRCAGRPGQGAGRIRPPDRAVRASLCAAQLSGQDARRDDARPRTRPRRAPGAGGAAGRAPVADAADAGRDRVGVRRDADLPRAPAETSDRSSASRCSRPRSRT